MLIKTAPIISAPRFPVAIADHNNNGQYDPGQDSVIFFKDEHFGGSAVDFQVLKESVARFGGTATAAQLSGQEGAHQEINQRWFSFNGMPQGLQHPIADYALRLTDDQLFVDYAVADQGSILPSGDVAGEDLNGDGEVEPVNDSLFKISLRSRQGGGVSGLLSYEELSRALKASGGQADLQALGPHLVKPALSRMRLLAEDEVSRVEIQAWPERLHGEERGEVSRRLTLEEDGRITVRYSVQASPE